MNFTLEEDLYLGDVLVREGSTIEVAKKKDYRTYFQKSVPTLLREFIKNGLSEAEAEEMILQLAQSLGEKNG